MNMMALNNEGEKMETEAARAPVSMPFRPDRNNHTVYALDRIGRIIDTNETVAPLTGYGQDDLAGHRFSEYLEPGAAEGLAGMLSGRDRDNHAAVETMVRCRDGRKRPVRGWMVRLRDEDGECSGVMVYLEPALVWVAPEPEALDQEDDDLADVVSDAVIAAAAGGTVIAVNPAGRRMFALEDDEAVVSLGQLLDPLERDRVMSALAGAADAIAPLVAVLKRRDGKRFIGKVSASRRPGGGLRLVIQNLSSDREIERFGLALENASGPGRFCFALLDADGRVVSLDPGFAAMFGYERWEKMVGYRIEGQIRDDPDNDDSGPGPAKAMLNLAAREGAARWKRISVVRLGDCKLIIASRP